MATIATALKNMGALAMQPPGGTVPALPKPLAPIQPVQTAQTMAAPAALPTPTPPPPGGIAPTADESVTSQFTRITQAGGPLMKMASQAGYVGANRRGLLNSSMAVGASQAETYKAALPLAQQEASTAAARNLAAADRTGQMERLTFSADAELARLQKSLDQADESQKRGIIAEMERLKTSGAQNLEQIRTQGEVQGGLADKDNAAQAARLQSSLAAELTRLDKQIASSEGQQKLELQGQKERLEISGRMEMERLAKAGEIDRQRVTLQGQIESALSAQGATQAQELQKLQGTIQTALQTQADAGAMERMKVTFDQNVKLQAGENAAQLERIKASGDQNMRTLLTQTEASLKELSMQLAAGDKAKIAELSVAVFEKEAAMRAALLSNPEMPAAERAAYERAISSMGDPVRAYINALYTPAQPGGAPGGIAPIPSPSPVSVAPVAPSTGIAPTAPAGSPLAGKPVIDFGPTAGLVYDGGKFFDPATGDQVDPKAYAPPAPSAQPAAAPATIAPSPAGGYEDSRGIATRQVMERLMREGLL